MTWKTEPILAIDLETTGLSPQRGDKIVQVAVELRHGGKAIGRMSQLINPGRPIPQVVTNIHGISDADVADAPTIEEHAAKVLHYVSKSDVLVAYNYPFDYSFLSAEIPEWADAVAGKHIIDPLVLVRMPEVGKFWHGKGRHKLINVHGRLRGKNPIDRSGKNKGGLDCFMCLNVLEDLAEHLPDDAEEAARLLAGERADQDDNFKAWKAKSRNHG